MWAEGSSLELSALSDIFRLHIVVSSVIRQYIPALITSMLCLPISILIITQCIPSLNCNTATRIVFSLIGVAVVARNLRFAHFLMRLFTKKMNTRQDRHA